MQNPDGTDLKSLGLGYLVIKHKKTFLIIAIATVLLSYLFSSSFFITPLYKSTTILYPTSTNSISKVLLSTNFNSSKDVLEFGEDEQTERMLQILNSNKIREKIIEKYDLMSHYGISKNDTYKNTTLFKEFENKIKFQRTEYMAVKISVLDKDPEIAADIANDIAELFDSTMNNMQKEVASKALKIVESEYFKLRDEVKFMEDSLNVIRRLGIHDYESQSEMFNQQLAMELAKNNKPAIKALEEKLSLLGKYGGTYVTLRDNIEHERKQLSAIKAKYEEAKVDANQSLPHKFVVTSAYKAERKTYPIRWLIVVIALFSTLFLTTLALIILDRQTIEELKKKTHGLNSKQLSTLEDN